MHKNLLEKIRKKIQNDKVVDGKLGATIKLKRKQGDHTLQEISLQHGVSVSYLSKIENNHMKPNVRYISEVLETLKINEDVFSSSIVMNDWYDKLINTVMGIHQEDTDLFSYIKERNDFQSKFIEFTLDVYVNNQVVSDQRLNELLLSVELLKPIELTIFVFTLTKNYINQKDYFAAGQLLKELKEKYIDSKILKLWQYELLFELALYQYSYTYLNIVAEKLSKYYFEFRMDEKAALMRKKYVEALSYFLPPSEHQQKNYDQSYNDFYQQSLIWYEHFDMFLKIKEKDEFAQILFDDYHENSKKVKQSLKYLKDSSDPLKQLVKIYLESKYMNDNEYEVLRELFFSDTGYSNHYYAMKFMANKLCKNLKNKHQYKECTQIDVRLAQLKRLCKVSLKQVNI